MTLSRPRPSVAGASAQAKYRELWAEGRRQRLVIRAALTLAALLVVGVLWSWPVAVVVAALVAVVDTVYRWRTHEAVKTWRKGAVGERRTARALRPLQRRGYTVLHDRSLPRSRANVDHIVIGEAGVFVVDTKNWNGNRRITRRGRYVKVGRMSGDKAVDAVIWESGLVAKVLSEELGYLVEVVPVLAIQGPHVPLLRVVKVEGVPLLHPSQVRTWIVRSGRRLTPEQVARVSEAAERLLPAYVVA